MKPSSAGQRRLRWILAVMLFISPLLLTDVLASSASSDVAPGVRFGLGASLIVLLVSLTVAMLVTLFSLFSRRVRRREQAAAIRANFSGLIDPETLLKLERSPWRLSGRARERVLTVMFIDIAGFSLSSEEQNPKRLFKHLQSYAHALQELVHRYGGTVDKLHGDGLLCYFGFDFVTGQGLDGHAAQAVACAVAMQRANLMLCKNSYAAGEPVYPLRIGINTGPVIIGDIGNSERYDFTIIGHGVNLAKRMEQSADYFKILVNGTTQGLLRSIETPKVTVNKKYVQIKHSEDLREAYEINPLANRSKQVEWVIKKYRGNLGIARRQQRHQLATGVNIVAYTDYGSAQIVDHSSKGLGIKLHRFMANGCEVLLRLDSGEPLGRALKSFGIQEIVGEVRWASAAQKGYQHGLIIKNLSPRQLGVLHAVLRSLGGQQELLIAV